MSVVKKFRDVTVKQILVVAASLASVVALMSTTNLCFLWFNQPKMPESVRHMGKMKP